MFRCDGDELGHIVFGSHDGIGSWTLNLDVLSESAQPVVVAHERAHHHLQASSVWGTAMIAAATVDTAGDSADQTWLGLAQLCRTVHETFATYVSAVGIDNGLEHYRGNMTYLQYFGTGEAMVGGLGLSLAGAGRAIEDLCRALMSPAWLTRLDFHGVRDLGAQPQRWRSGPDARLRLLGRYIGDEAHRQFLRNLFEQTADSRDRWDPLAASLSAYGIDCPDLAEFSAWTTETVAQISEYLVVPISVEQGGRDTLRTLVDNHSRERLRLYSRPLPVRVTRATEQQPATISAFARTAVGTGPHVWVTWLPADFLARQFDGGRVFAADQVLAMLACDRRGDDPHAILADFTSAQPAMVARFVSAASLQPLFFTTVRALHHSSQDIDFRFWDPVFVLVDTDAHEFFSHLADSGETYVWTVLGVSGTRNLDLLLLRAESAPALTYALPGSVPTGRIFSAWLDSMSDVFRQSSEAFVSDRFWLAAQIDHLVGTFHVLDQFGADVALKAPAPAPSMLDTEPIGATAEGGTPHRR